MSGFTKVGNTVLEEVAARKFNASQLSVLMIVWRKTFGYQKEDEELAVNYFVKATGFSKRNIQDTINSLIDAKVLKETQKASFNQTRKISFNENSGEWLVESRTKLPQVKDCSPHEENFTSPDEQKFTSPGEGSCTHERKVKEISKERDDGDLKDLPVPYLEYEKLFGIPSPILIQQFNQWIDDSQFKEPEAIICETIRRAKLQTPDNPGAYINSILKKLHNLELYTLDAVKAYNEKFDSKTKNHKNGAVPSLTNMFNRREIEKPLSAEELREIEEMEDEFPF
ncbi:replication protein [Pseudogracilibacillus auburnensis]|uniref:replication protein n=1 Tax=Pseudogracilibacillus auburnensis TaxID=1494959 RepID=UPI001A97ADBC|nr:replication protein [Pseudogracilibacillus auburnensis]MBO1005756.1 replication protein [Pseudogracilibacillus auburnensis]